jgi:cell division septation protein DedD
MDRRVKERLVGATILLVLIVVVVPELLSGPKQAAKPAPLTLPVPVHSYTVDVTDHSLAPTTTGPTAADIAASAAASAVPAAAPAVATAAAPSDEPAPVSAPGSAPTAHEATAPAARATNPGSEPAPLESGASPPTSSKSDTNKAVASSAGLASASHRATGAWAVQLGSFASKPNADKLVRALAGKGYVLTVSAAGSGASLRYRVRISSLADREAAERVLERLKAQGQAATLVPPS